MNASAQERKSSRRYADGASGGWQPPGKTHIASKQRRRLQRINDIRNGWPLYVMIALPLAYFIIFRYIPMTNIVIAFKDYNMFKTVWSAPWAQTKGAADIWKYFKQAFGSAEFSRVLGNTIKLNLLDLVCGFPMPVLIALLLNEIAYNKFKRFVQTVYYMPNFLSWIIISGIAMQIFAPESGVINILLGKLGHEPIPFLSNPGLWTATYVFLGVWQSAGYGAIVYLAAISAIDQEIYEAAEVDGAGRLRKIWNVTLPAIKPTIVVMLILALGRIMASGFDRPYALGNPIVRGVSDVIATYVYRTGIMSMQYSLTTAVGLFQSAVCLIFLVGTNVAAERLGERGIW